MMIELLVGRPHFRIRTENEKNNESVRIAKVVTTTVQTYHVQQVRLCIPQDKALITIALTRPNIDWLDSKPKNMP